VGSLIVLAGAVIVTEISWRCGAAQALMPHPAAAAIAPASGLVPTAR
jgi:hypothetical protein